MVEPRNSEAPPLLYVTEKYQNFSTLKTYFNKYLYIFVVNVGHWLFLQLKNI